jgi:hypothetical protein
MGATQTIGNNMNQRLTTCISLRLKQKKKSFLHKIVIGDDHKQWLDSITIDTTIESI